MTTALKKWGNSQGIRLSSELLKHLKWNENDIIDIEISDNKITLKKAENDCLTINDLFKDYTEDYHPTEIDWGKPVGKEVW